MNTDQHGPLGVDETREVNELFPVPHFLGLAHARCFRDRLAQQALADHDATPEQIERWCRAEGNYREQIEQVMKILGENFDGNGVGGYWLYLRQLKAAIEYISQMEKELARGGLTT
jgi:hypothetical protein